MKRLTILLRTVIRLVSVPNHGSPALRLPISVRGQMDRSSTFKRFKLDLYGPGRINLRSSRGAGIVLSLAQIPNLLLQAPRSSKVRAFNGIEDPKVLETQRTMEKRTARLKYMVRYYVMSIIELSSIYHSREIPAGLIPILNKTGQVYPRTYLCAVEFHLAHLVNLWGSGGSSAKCVFLFPRPFFPGQNTPR